MTSSNGSNSSTAEMNELAETSRWLGICSILPYLLSGILFYIEKRIDEHFFQAEFILALFCSFWGIVVGSLTLIIGIVAIRQITNGQNMEKGTPSAVFGIVLGLSAIVFNILFVSMIFFQIVSA